MVVLNRIYTRTGDKGSTALSDGQRVGKDSVRVEAYGTVDETNATVGLARLHAPEGMGERLAAIQNDLFDVGADLARPLTAAEMATPETETETEAEKTAEGQGIAEAEAQTPRPARRDAHPPLRVQATQVARLEAEIDAMNAGLSPLRSFVLPAGTPLSAHLHLCRTACRRAERLAVRLGGLESVNPEALRYLNRLSDWFFVAARTANGGEDVLWVPGANR